MHVLPSELLNVGVGAIACVEHPGKEPFRT